MKTIGIKSLETVVKSICKDLNDVEINPVDITKTLGYYDISIKGVMTLERILMIINILGLENSVMRLKKFKNIDNKRP